MASRPIKPNANYSRLGISWACNTGTSRFLLVAGGDVCRLETRRPNMIWSRLLIKPEESRTVAATLKGWTALETDIGESTDQRSFLSLQLRSNSVLGTLWALSIRGSNSRRVLGEALILGTNSRSGCEQRRKIHIQYFRRRYKHCVCRYVDGAHHVVVTVEDRCGNRSHPFREFLIN